MQEICRLASERFGDQVEPVVPRMIELVKILERNKLIKFV